MIVKCKCGSGWFMVKKIDELTRDIICVKCGNKIYHIFDRDVWWYEE